MDIGPIVRCNQIKAVFSLMSSLPDFTDASLHPAGPSPLQVRKLAIGGHCYHLEREDRIENWISMDSGHCYYLERKRTK